MKKGMSRLLIFIMGMMIVMGGCTKSKNESSDLSGDQKIYTPAEPYTETGSETETEMKTEETADGILSYDMNSFTVLDEDRSLAADVTGETYDSVNEQGFQNALSQPMSTFSIDVDTASYANMRRYLEDGMLPPADAIRIEEMLNYFDYQYEEPEAGDVFSMNTELTVCPWNEDHYLLGVGIMAKEVEREVLPKSNLVFLIDISGSMDSPDKLPLLKNAFGQLVKELDEDDRVSIVVYAGETGIVLDSAYGNNHDEIINAINRLEAGGGTGGASGIDLAYQLAKKNYREEGNNRVILATDGDFNIGPSSVEELEDLIVDKREDGIFLSVIGFGTGNLRDHQMETLANKGNGNYSYIDSEQEAKKVLVDEMSGTLLTLAKDVKVQIEFNPTNVSKYRLIGYDNRLLKAEDFRDDTVDAGEVGAGHSIRVLYEVIPSASTTASNLKYQDKEPVEVSGQFAEELAQLNLRYQDLADHKVKETQRVISSEHKAQNDMSEDLSFMAAVAEFGMILKDSTHSGNGSVEQAISLASDGVGEDVEGYRREFIGLMEQYKEIIYH